MINRDGTRCSAVSSRCTTCDTVYMGALRIMCFSGSFVSNIYLNVLALREHSTSQRKACWFMFDMFPYKEALPFALQSL